MLCITFFCSDSYALPQDWPCFGIEVEKQETISRSENNFEYAYQGETQGYDLKINLSGVYEFSTSFADCGNAGCLGKITEKSTGRTEVLRFFCERYNNDYTKVTCYVGFGEEAVFTEESVGNYVLHYCSDNLQKTLRFNVKDCKQCHCIMYWYDGNMKNETGQYGMSCKKQKGKAHCFTYYGYETWRNFENNDNDFQNCIGLEW